MRPHHALVGSATIINNRTGLSIVTVQSLVASLASPAPSPHDPYNHVTDPVCRSDKRRTTAAAASIHSPRAGYGRRISCSNAESRKGLRVAAKSDVGALFGSIGCCCLDDFAA